MFAREEYHADRIEVLRRLKLRTESRQFGGSDFDRVQAEGLRFETDPGGGRLLRVERGRSVALLEAPDGSIPRRGRDGQSR